MLKKRIIPCLDIQNGRTVKGVNFKNIKDAGCPIELAQNYEKEGADELVFLAINAKNETAGSIIELIQKISSRLRIPFTIGGGIHSLEDAANYLKAGADKVSLNSSAVVRPELIREIADQYGSQCVVVAIDAKWVDQDWYVTTQGGNNLTNLKVYDWVRQVEKLGAGEILLTSMDDDGMKQGFAIELTQKVCELVQLPVIASGGAGSITDFKAVFENTKATGALAASVFHFQEIKIQDLKSNLIENNIPIRQDEIRL
jgi:imidazole glycerol-phosphate synthase subunit HisF